MEHLRTLRSRYERQPPPEGGAADSVIGRVADLCELSDTFQGELEASEAAFREERRLHLTSLQARLRRLVRP